MKSCAFRLPSRVGTAIVIAAITASSQPGVARSHVATERPSLAPPQRTFVDIAGVEAKGGNKLIVSVDQIGVYVVSAAGKITAFIGTQNTGIKNPGAIATDTSGTFYVVDQTIGVVAFPKPYTKSGALYSESGLDPSDVAYDASSGNLAVAFNRLSVGTSPNVSIYPMGSNVPCAVIPTPDADWGRVRYVAFDKAGNIYVDGANQFGDPRVGLVTGGCAAKTMISLVEYKMRQTFDTLAVARGGSLLISQGSSRDKFWSIDSYAPANGKLGERTGKESFYGAFVPDFVLDSDGSSLWAPVNGNLISQFRYPGHGTPIRTFALFSSGTQINGIAVNPLAVP